MAKNLSAQQIAYFLGIQKSFQINRLEKYQIRSLWEIFFRYILLFVHKILFIRKKHTRKQGLVLLFLWLTATIFISRWAVKGMDS